MNDQQARQFLASALTFGIRLGLHRMQRLMALLDHPEQNLACIHIAGTNGKGSVTAYCGSILAAGGYKVGVFTSPYIERFSERIRILNGPAGLAALAADETYGEISPDDLTAIMTAIQTAVDQMLADGEEHPTEFELITAAAFCHFARQHCDWVVLETGLGGRLDSTNVIARPHCCIITALGYDHMDRLGSTLAEIAAEKAGIIKPGCPTFLYDPAAAVSDPSAAAAARTVIENRCREMGAPLTISGPEQVESLTYDWDGQTFRCRPGPQPIVETAPDATVYRTRLLGLFQPVNAWLAIQACRPLVAPSALVTGIAAARWPVRLEVCRRQPAIILDGAHNPQGCQALAAALERLLPGQPVIFLAGMLQDKDYPTMLTTILAQHTYRPLAFICVTPDNPRALPASDLADAVRAAWTGSPTAAAGPLDFGHPAVEATAETGKITMADPTFELIKGADCGYNSRDMILIADQPTTGARLALQLANQCGAALCAFGSLYMVGSIRKVFDQSGG